MFHRRRQHIGSWLVVALLLGFGWVGAAPAQQAKGKLDQLDCSLKSVPADAAFYISFLRNKEQVDAVVKSKAWSRLAALPLVKEAWQKAQAELQNQPDQPLLNLIQFFQAPENKPLLDLLADMASQEVFMYGGDNYAGFAELLVIVSTARQFGPALELLSGNTANLQRGDLQVRSALQALKENTNLLKVPNLVIGFKLTDTKRADNQLKRLEDVLLGQLEKSPLKGRLKREKAAGGEFLSLSLDGQLVPWKDLPLAQFEEKPGEFEPLIKKLSALKLTVSVGIKDPYLLVTVGESTAAVLSARAELQPLARFADRKLTSIRYVSQAMVSQVSTNRSDIDNLAQQIKEELGQQNLTPAQKQKIDKDLAELAKDLKSLLPKPGAQMSFSFLTERGCETYSHDWGEHPAIDGSKPLTLVNHLGGSPLVATVGRAKYAPENYQLLVKWLKVGHGYVEQFAVPNLDDEQKKQYQEFMKVAAPLLQRLDEVTGKMLLPSLADGQSGFVLDARLTNKQWLPNLPPSDKPLPMLEPALVFGVSDAALLQKACGQYRAIANDLLLQFSKLNPNPALPDLQIPPAESKKGKNGTLWFYALPDAWGLDKRLLPNAGVSDKVAALSISLEHSERLLAVTPLQTAGGPLADLKRPLAAVSLVDWAGMVDAVIPWFDYGVQLAGPNLGDDGAENVKQLRTVLDVLKAFRGFASCSYFEGKVLVTHSEIVIQDVK